MVTRSMTKAAAASTQTTTPSSVAQPASAAVSQPTTAQQLPTSHNLAITPIEQDQPFSCWAASSKMVYQNYAGAPLGDTQAELAKKQGKALNRCQPIVGVLKNLKVDAGEDTGDYLPQPAEYKQAVFNGEPLVLTVTEKTSQKGTYEDNASGGAVARAHYMVVSGYKGDKLMVIDPAQASPIPHEVALPARKGASATGNTVYANPPTIRVGANKYAVLMTYYTNNAGITPSASSQTASTSSRVTGQKRKVSSATSRQVRQKPSGP